jgi:Lrp/AsnC family leucine-responsive transcriptional regulator
VAEIHKLSGNSCAMLRVRVASMRHLEGLFERLG